MTSTILSKTNTQCFVPSNLVKMTIFKILFTGTCQFNQNNTLFQNRVNNNNWATRSDSNERGEYKAWIKINRELPIWGLMQNTNMWLLFTRTQSFPCLTKHDDKDRQALTGLTEDKNFDNELCNTVKIESWRKVYLPWLRATLQPERTWAVVQTLIEDSEQSASVVKCQRLPGPLLI